MDVLLDNDGLKAASRTFPGHFSLMPAFGYGPWLSVAGMNGGRPLDIDGVEDVPAPDRRRPDASTRAPRPSTAACSTTTTTTASTTT